jgi:serine protease inhibitor
LDNGNVERSASAERKPENPGMPNRSMIMWRKLTVVALLALSMAGCTSKPKIANGSAASMVTVTEAENDFGFRLLRTLAPDRAPANVTVSPLSISQALTMTYNGAGGGTKKAMAQTLGIVSMSSDTVNGANRQLLKSLHQPLGRRGFLHGLFKRRRNRKAWLAIANALWIERTFSINRDFVGLNEDFYGAEVQSLDFIGDPQRATDEINAWVKRNTQGKVPTIVEGLQSDTRLVLTDAVYFKGRWKEPFDPRFTSSRSFFLLDGKSVMTPMMMTTSLRETYPYLETDTFQAVRMPYANPRFAMYVFLPRKKDGLQEFLGSLDHQHWKDWTAGFKLREGIIGLPRFQLRYGNKLNDALSAMGMAVAFRPGAADFSGIESSRQLYLSDVEHKTFVKVDEQGTEAAAATVVVAVASARHFPGPFEMIVDHPFLFAIAEQQSGAILFLGTVIDPSHQD